MRTSAVALLGLAAMASAAPTVERRQFSIGTPGSGTVIVPSNPAPGGAILPPSTVVTTPIRIGRRTENYFWLPSDHLTDKQNIVKAELQLQVLTNLLKTTKDKDERKAIEACIKSIQDWLKKVAGITNISSPPGTTTIFIPGKRDGSTADLEAAYFKLLEPYKTGAIQPDLPTYLIILHYRELLIAKGVKVDIITFGPVTSGPIVPAGKRQIFTIGGCRDEDVIGLRATLTSLLIIYGRNPPFEIYNLELAIIAALKACKQEIEVGDIIPQKPSPGSPVTPNPTVPGGTVVPNPTVPGGTVVPEPVVSGGAVKPAT